MKLELYNDEHHYTFPDGELATKEEMFNRFPLIKHFPHVIKIDSDRVCHDAMNILVLMHLYDIPDDVLIEDAEAQLNALQISPTPEELATATVEFMADYEAKEAEHGEPE